MTVSINIFSYMLLIKNNFRDLNDNQITSQFNKWFNISFCSKCESSSSRAMNENFGNFIETNDDINCSLYCQRESLSNEWGIDVQFYIKHGHNDIKKIIGCYHLYYSMVSTANKTILDNKKLIYTQNLEDDLYCKLAPHFNGNKLVDKLLINSIIKTYIFRSFDKNYRSFSNIIPGYNDFCKNVGCILIYEVGEKILDILKKQLNSIFKEFKVEDLYDKEKHDNIYLHFAILAHL